MAPFVQYLLPTDRGKIKRRRPKEYCKFNDFSSELFIESTLIDRLPLAYPHSCITAKSLRRVPDGIEPKTYLTAGSRANHLATPRQA